MAKQVLEHLLEVSTLFWKGKKTIEVMRIAIIAMVPIITKLMCNFFKKQFAPIKLL
jgi:hypothetical protein